MTLEPTSTKSGDEIVVFSRCQKTMIRRPLDKLSGTYHVVGECSMQNLACGKALLGPLPNEYQQIMKVDRRTGLSRWAHRVNATGHVQYEDPRFGIMQTENRQLGQKNNFGKRRVYVQHPSIDVRNNQDEGLWMWTSKLYEEAVEVVGNVLEPFVLE